MGSINTFYTSVLRCSHPQPYVRTHLEIVFSKDTLTVKNFEFKCKTYAYGFENRTVMHISAH